MLQADRQRKMQGVEKMLQRDRQRKNIGEIYVCLFLSYFYPPQNSHRNLEEGKREEQNRVALETLVP